MSAPRTPDGCVTCGGNQPGDRITTNGAVWWHQRCPEPASPVQETCALCQTPTPCACAGLDVDLARCHVGHDGCYTDRLEDRDVCVACERDAARLEVARLREIARDGSVHHIAEVSKMVPVTCPLCDGPLTCDPLLREALAGEKHLSAQLLYRTETAEIALESLKQAQGNGPRQ